jgi:TorA maturation chaperone TorD
MSRAELLRALAAVADSPQAATPALVTALDLGRAPSAAELTDLFSFQVYPYASVHLGDEGMLGGEARDRVAGFLRALDVTPPAEPDLLVTLLHAYADLSDLADTGSARAAHARGVLLHEHLGSWVGRFLARVAELGASPLVRWSQLLTSALADELAQVGPPPVLPPALLAAGSPPDPDEGTAAEWVGAVLAPVRSGMVLARADLARAARELELGNRVGERAFVLRSLLDQDAPAVLGWLAGEARRQAEGLDTVAATGGELVAQWWRDRLHATAEVLTGALATGVEVAQGAAQDAGTE